MDAPNCIFEVDDLLQEWTWNEPFDYIFIRHLIGSFDKEGWETLYRQCYENLEPGGWIEQLEFDIRVHSDDKSLPPDSELASWGENFIGCGDRAQRSLAVQETTRASIEKAGFVDVHEVPMGAWPRDKVLKEIGQLNHHHWATDMKGCSMWLPTKFVCRRPGFLGGKVYMTKVRNELKNHHYHIYEFGKVSCPPQNNYIVNWSTADVKPREDEVKR
ncbi:hypothetical protein N7532_006899 [Penicillium argentinense]|uniref:Uncharacterized protein n=1 Tax=Penicillium argentinense TaxID=1131581 RepID=A0A9W9KBD3_9EURO|nr:uncharacterized protein N7532_006899 [Penicillium argentinense]KAJ5099898.1 hypothetical protein N7532_006899 [Penicillium argentinense]